MKIPFLNKNKKETTATIDFGRVADGASIGGLMGIYGAAMYRDLYDGVDKVLDFYIRTITAFPNPFEMGFDLLWNPLGTIIATMIAAPLSFAIGVGGGMALGATSEIAREKIIKPKSLYQKDLKDIFKASVPRWKDIPKNPVKWGTNIIGRLAFGFLGAASITWLFKNGFDTPNMIQIGTHALDTGRSLIGLAEDETVASSRLIFFATALFGKTMVEQAFNSSSRLILPFTLAVHTSKLVTQSAMALKEGVNNGTNAAFDRLGKASWAWAQMGWKMLREFGAFAITAVTALGAGLYTSLVITQRGLSAASDKTLEITQGVMAGDFTSASATLSESFAQGDALLAIGLGFAALVTTLPVTFLLNKYVLRMEKLAAFKPHYVPFIKAPGAPGNKPA